MEKFAFAIRWSRYFLSKIPSLTYKIIRFNFKFWNSFHHSYLHFLVKRFTILLPRSRFSLAGSRHHAARERTIWRRSSRRFARILALESDSKAHLITNSTPMRIFHFYLMVLAISSMHHAMIQSSCTAQTMTKQNGVPFGGNIRQRLFVKDSYRMLSTFR